MSESIQLDGGELVVVTRDASAYPERFLLQPGQERTLEMDIIRRVKAKTGITSLAPLSNEAGIPVHQPLPIPPQKVLRLCDGYSERINQAVDSLAGDLVNLLIGKNARFYIQVGCSEQTDNGENMFGDYLYIRARAFPAR